jgi:hypothetical protein
MQSELSTIKTFLEGGEGCEGVGMMVRAIYAIAHVYIRVNCSLRLSGCTKIEKKKLNNFL